MKQLQSLVLQGNPITDVGMSHIKPMKQLQYFYLSNAQINDADLRYLKELPQLHELSIYECPQITDAGIKDLQNALPKLKITR